ncbi:MAG TPA: TIGR02221 family CRISPR-associated protein [Clostridiaceae bacterium]|nr:TIGR02221 family CRISPR-associated protein [Clostridiaceae bacterium]
MAKILISSLGTGRLEKNQTSSREYSRTTYRFQDSDKEYKTPFVAVALSDYLQVDRLYLVGTSKSMWEEVYNYFATNSNQEVDYDYWNELCNKVTSFKPGNDKIDEKDLSKVNQAIDGYLKYLRPSASGGSHCYVIDYGLNEKELWANFDVFMRIGEEFKEGDEIYLDITHAFRSIPLFNYLMLDLVGILKFNCNIKLKGLFYGMLDVISDLGYAPIVDLSPLYNITLWSRGAYNFTNFGNGYLLADLINDNDISQKIRNISDIVNINYIDDFKREVDSLNHLLNNSVLSEPVVKYMDPYLQSFINRFKGISTSSQLQFSLAKWYFDNKRYAHGYICLAECIITKILEIYRVRDSKISWGEASRKKIKNLIYSKEFKDIAEYRKVHDEYENIRLIRNKIAHAGFLDRKTFKEDINEACNYLNRVEKYVINNSALNRLPDRFPFNQLNS